MPIKDRTDSGAAAREGGQPRRPRRSVQYLRYTFPVVGALFTGALGIAAYTAHVLNGPRRPDPLDGFSFTPWEVQVPFEPVSFETEDGITIRGWWLPRPHSNRVVIGFTGHKGVKQDLLGIGSALWRAGCNVLLFDFRGCGESDIAAVSLAHHELQDARAAVRYARSRMPGAGVGVVGYSMGAAIAILVAAQEPAIRAVVADSSFASMKDVIAHAYGRYRLPIGPAVLLTDAVNRLRYGYRFSAVRPVEAVETIAPRPLLLIHGSADRLIPVQHAHRLHAAAKEPRDLWVVEGAGHCGAYFDDRDLYVERVTRFFESALA